PVEIGIAATAAIADADVEITVGAEIQPAAVVVGTRLLDGQDQRRAVRIGNVGIVLGNPVSAYLGVALGICQVDVEQAIVGVVRIEGQSQQALLVSVGNRADVEKRPGGNLACGKIEDLDQAAVLLHDEQPPLVPIRRRREHRQVEPRSDEFDIDPAGVFPLVGSWRALMPAPSGYHVCMVWSECALDTACRFAAIVASGPFRHVSPPVQRGRARAQRTPAEANPVAAVRLRGEGTRIRDRGGTAADRLQIRMSAAESWFLAMSSTISLSPPPKSN